MLVAGAVLLDSDARLVVTVSGWSGPRTRSRSSSSHLRQAARSSGCRSSVSNSAVTPSLPTRLASDRSGASSGLHPQLLGSRLRRAGGWWPNSCRTLQQRPPTTSRLPWHPLRQALHATSPSRAVLAASAEGHGQPARLALQCVSSCSGETVGLGRRRHGVDSLISSWMARPCTNATASTSSAVSAGSRLILMLRQLADCYGTRNRTSTVG